MGSGSGRRWLWWTLGGLVVCLGAWALFAQLVVPPIIDAAYHEQSHPFFNRLIPGRHLNPVTKYLREWQQVFWLTCGAMVAAWGLLQIPARAYHRLIGETTAGSIGAIRVLVFAIMIISTVWEDVASLAFLPGEMRAHTAHTMVLIHWLRDAFPPFDALHSSYTGLLAFKYVSIGLMGLAMLGLWTRLTVPLATICYLLIAGMFRQYSWFYHTGLIPLYLGIALSFMPCGDGWSMDRVLRIARGRRVVDADLERPLYGLCRYVIWMLVALAYTAAGLSKLKLGGLMWWQGDNLRHFLYYDSLNPMHFDFEWSLHLRHLPNIFFAMLGISALVGEAGYVLVLVSRWARLIFPAVTAMMHIGILFFQNILFFDLIPLQAIFYDWRRIRKWYGRRLAASRGIIEVLYDGFCPLCQRTVAILRGMDLFERMRFVDFRTADLAAFNAAHGTGITLEALEHEMFFVYGRRAFAGFDGYRRMMPSVPLFWPLVPIMYFPGVAAVGRSVYGWVAARRRLLVCDESCRPDVITPADTAALLRRPRFALPICFAIAGVMATCWLFRVERFPLTAMQMYHTVNTKGVLLYRKPLAHYSDGSVEEARFDRWIGATADGRYRAMIDMAMMGREGVPEKFFDACLARANALARDGRKVEYFEVQQIVWDYKRDIDNPTFGDVEKVYRYPPAAVTQPAAPGSVRADSPGGAAGGSR